MVGGLCFGDGGRSVGIRRACYLREIVRRRRVVWILTVVRSFLRWTVCFGVCERKMWIKKERGFVGFGIC